MKKKDHKRKCKAKNQCDKCIFYEKVHTNKVACENHIKAIKKRGGKVEKATKNGKTILKYSFVKSSKK